MIKLNPLPDILEAARNSNNIFDDYDGDAILDWERMIRIVAEQEVKDEHIQQQYNTDNVDHE